MDFICFFCSSFEAEFLDIDYKIIKAAAEIGGAAFDVDEPAPEVAGAGQNLGGAGLNNSSRKAISSFMSSSVYGARVVTIKP